MKGLNQVQLIGNLGAAPEMMFTPAGKAKTTFSMATTRKYKNGAGELLEDTDWHRIVTWETLAESCNQSLEKGSLVFVQGRINNRSWEDETGAKHYACEIVASTVIFLGSKKQAAPAVEDAPELEAAAAA